LGVRRSTIPVVLLAALSFLGGLGRGAIGDNDEAFYAESAREMVESGNWLTPHFNYEPRFQKPALYYWVTAALFAVGGAHEFSARLFAALAGMGLVLVTTACGRRWYDESVGLLAGAIAATSFGYFALARMALPDLPLAFFITCAIWAALVATMERERDPRGWLLWAAFVAALGFLVKGPLALVLPALVVAPILLLERRSYNVQLPDVVLAALLFMVLALPWYAAMWLQHGTDYLVGFFVGDNFERFATDRFNDPRPWWFYLPILAGGLLPWTPLALAWVRPSLQFVTRRRDIGTVDFRLLLWAALPLIFFTLSVGKQPRYILPVLPPLAILLASSILERTSEWHSVNGLRRRPRPNGVVVTGCVLSGLFLLSLAVLLYRAQPLFVGVGRLNTLFAAAVIAIGGHHRQPRRGVAIGARRARAGHRDELCGAAVRRPGGITRLDRRADGAARARRACRRRSRARDLQGLRAQSRFLHRFEAPGHHSRRASERLVDEESARFDRDDTERG
jgi:4-amino-4-deoxy-L-arabinose transferase-like glycosyltransferase